MLKQKQKQKPFKTGKFPPKIKSNIWPGNNKIIMTHQNQKIKYKSTLIHYGYIIGETFNFFVFIHDYSTHFIWFYD